MGAALNIAITGHRKLFERDRSIVIERVRRFRDEGVGAVFVGGALGVDTLVVETLLDQERHPTIVTVVPCRIDDQPIAVRAILRRSDQIIELGIPITDRDGWQAYKVRNQYMVDHCDRLVAFHNGSTQSGTWSTMHYANRIGRPVEVVGIS